MLISLEWLREYVDFDLSPAELAEKLTMVGLELEDFISAPIQELGEVVVGKIVLLRPHPNADKLYLLTVDTGEGTKKVVAGIREHYTKEELVNRQAVMINNLEPATIRGQRSDGMILATRDGEKLAILVPDKEVKVGSPVS